MVLKLKEMLEKWDNKFENDVEMYGAQAVILLSRISDMFENDVEMYGAQAK